MKAGEDYWVTKWYGRKRNSKILLYSDINKLPLYVFLQNKYAEITSPSLCDINLHGLILLYLWFTAICYSQWADRTALLVIFLLTECFMCGQDTIGRKTMVLISLIMVTVRLSCRASNVRVQSLTPGWPLWPLAVHAAADSRKYNTWSTAARPTMGRELTNTDTRWSWRVSTAFVLGQSRSLMMIYVVAVSHVSCDTCLYVKKNSSLTEVLWQI